MTLNFILNICYYSLNANNCGTKVAVIAIGINPMYLPVCLFSTATRQWDCLVNLAALSNALFVLHKEHML